MNPVLSPDALLPLLHDPDVRVIDIRPPAEYAEGHVPGALSAPYAIWRGPANSPGTVPELSVLTQNVRQLGLTPDTHAVLLSSGANTTDFGATARVYWTLKYLGLNRLSILNGGMQAWTADDLPLSKTSSDVAHSDYTPVLNHSIVASAADVQGQIGNPDARLVDARPQSFFVGDLKAPTASTPGTIQGAINIEHSVWFVPDSTLIVSAEQAQAIAASRFPDLVDDTITFCNTGHWAATDWFALSELAGLPNIRMYPESLADWTNTAEPLPMANTPGRGTQILNKLKALIN